MSEPEEPRLIDVESLREDDTTVNCSVSDTLVAAVESVYQSHRNFAGVDVLLISDRSTSLMYADFEVPPRSVCSVPTVALVVALARALNVESSQSNT